MCFILGDEIYVCVGFWVFLFDILCKNMWFKRSWGGWVRLVLRKNVNLRKIIVIISKFLKYGMWFFVMGSGGVRGLNCMVYKEF